MANRKMNLSAMGKVILDDLCAALEIERPQAIMISLAKGISNSNGRPTLNDNKYEIEGKKWTIPDNIIRDHDFLLFKHLIINEVKSPLNDESLHSHMINYIEFGLRIIKKELDELSSLEDYRIKILTQT